MKKKTVVLGVTSGIAAYKTIELVQFLKKDKLEVLVVMTKNAARMVPPQDFEKASGNKVYIELFEKDFDYKNILKSRKVDHIDLADKADIFVIAPATANTIAKIAYGMADDFLTTSLLATQAPILVCPSMNVHMWENYIVQDNVQRLKKRGIHILDPEEGDLACGYKGKGRLAHIHHIRDEIVSVLQKKEQLKGKKILVTSGGTIEKIDDVRFIANKSSGKMGLAIAEECFYRGADVLLLRAENSVKSLVKIPEKVFETADDLGKLIKRYVPLHDIIFHTVAVSDFRATSTQQGKISSNKGIDLHLEPTGKIINTIKKLNPKITLIGFKAVWSLRENEVSPIARKKMQESNADVIIVNDVSKSDRGFNADKNEVFIVTKKGKKTKIPLRSKHEVAKDIIDFLL